MNKLLIFFAVCLFASSCSTSKFDYKTAYRFKYQQEHTGKEHTGEQQEQGQIQVQEQGQVPEQLEVSLKPVAQGTHTAAADPGIINQDANGSVAPITRESFDALSKTEKRAVRRQAKEDLKTLKMQVKKAEKEAAANDVVFNKKMYIGVVILAAGILVAILASGPVGAIGIIVGIGLIAWGFIEQA